MNSIELKSDIHNFSHKFRLTEYFHNFNNRQKSQKDDTNETFFKDKFYPPRIGKNTSKTNFLNGLDLADTRKEHRR